MDSSILTHALTPIRHVGMIRQTYRDSFYPRGLGFLLFCMLFPSWVLGSGDTEVEAMQKVIDHQQEEISAQRQALKAQQQQLDKQQTTLEILQFQVQTLLNEKADEGIEVARTGEVHSSGESRSEASLAIAAESAPPASDTTATDKSGADDRLHQTYLPINDHFLALDTKPLDIPDDTGFFIYSKNRTRVLRLYGSVRALAVYDNRQNFHPYDLNIPQVPYGDADVKDWNQHWTINTSKVGFQVGLLDYYTGVGEFDWKGEDGDALRIRHLYMRSNHLLIGKHWSGFNTLAFLPLSVDSHSTSAHLGVRPVQVKYIGGGGTWLYGASLEYFQPRFEEPGSIDASASNMLPNIVGRISYVPSWGKASLAGILAANRVKRNTVEGFDRSSDTGLGLMAGIAVNLNENNLIKAHVATVDGINQNFADFGFEKIDMIFNPATGEYENLRMVAGQIALEHQWTPTLITAIGAGYMNMKNRSFQQGNAFDHGYKALVNLFYRPGGLLNGLTLGTELEFAGQTTVDGSDGDTTRISVLAYYDW